MEVLHSARSGGVALDELLERSDFVTLHCPLTDDTRDLIGARALERDEADRAAGQHGARADRRPGRARATRCTSGRSPAPRSTSPTPSRCPPTIRCCCAPNLLVRPAHRLGDRRHAPRAMAELAVDNLLAGARRRADAAPGQLTRVAVVDIGTNSTRLLIADVDDGRRHRARAALDRHAARRGRRRHRRARRRAAGARPRGARRATPPRSPSTAPGTAPR